MALLNNNNIHLQVIEHVDEPLNFLSSCSACLDTSKETAPSLILSTINRYINLLVYLYILLTFKIGMPKAMQWQY